jgi:hypothetical protein
LLLSKSHKTPLSSFSLKFFILIKTSEDIEWFYLLIKLTFGFLQANIWREHFSMQSFLSSCILTSFFTTHSSALYQSSGSKYYWVYWVFFV